MSNTFSIVWQFSRIKTTYEPMRKMKNFNNFKKLQIFYVSQTASMSRSTNRIQLDYTSHNSRDFRNYNTEIKYGFFLKKNNFINVK